MVEPKDELRLRHDPRAKEKGRNHLYMLSLFLVRNMSA